MKLADTASLRNHPALINVGTLTNAGSSAFQVPVVGLNGTDIMSAVSDGSSVSNTSLTSTGITVTIARQALRYDITDLAKLTNPVAGGMGVDIDGIATAMVTSFDMRFTQLIAALSSGLSNSVGSTGTALTVANFYNAIFQLQLTSNDGVFTAVLHPKQVNDLVSSLRSETGPGQWLATSQDQVQAKGQGYRGNLFGVDVFTSTYAPSANAGADRLGMMFSHGAFGYAMGSPAPIRGAIDTIYPAGTPVVVELERDSAYALTKVVGNAYMGVAELQDAKGVGMLSRHE
jgi:hypothetical protein